MTVFKATVASSSRHVLAEGPVWVAETSSLIWVDLERGMVFEGKIADGRVNATRQLDFEGRVGAAVPGDDGSMLVALQDRLMLVAPDGTRLNGPDLVPPGGRSRSNDGKCDPAGRFVVGTMALDDRGGGESLYRLEQDGTLTVLDSDLTLSNGIAWSPDGSLMYNTDTVLGTIWVRDYDVETGVVGKRREHILFDGESPDGICVDSRGYLWVAMWGAGQVRSFSPTAIPGDVVEVPVPHVSSVAFVGDDLDCLLITTASRDLSEDDAIRYPNAGCLFFADVEVSGIPSSLWLSSGTG